MRFVAALDTVIFGVFYAQGAEVNTEGWTRKMLLQFLELGIIQAAYLTTGAISDRLEFNGDGVTTEIIGGKIVVTIDPEFELPPINYAGLADVDMSGLTDGQIPAWDAANGVWRPIDPPAGGGSGGSGLEINILRLLPVTATINGSPYTLGQLVDGVKGTSYVSLGTGSQALVVDLTTSVKIAKVRGYWYPDSRSYYECGIEISENGSDWTTLVARATRSFGAAPQYIEGVPSPSTQYRYVRFHSNGSTLNTNNEMTEIEVYAQLAVL